IPYKYTMLPEPGYPRNVCLRRFYSHHVFGKNLSKYLEEMKKPDVIIAAVPSLDVGTVVGNYCSKYKIPFIVDIQDLWPEAFKLVLKIPVVNEIVFLPMTLQANHFYGQADRIVAVSETYMQRGLENNKKDQNGLCVYLGTDLGKFDENCKKVSIEKHDGEIWIAYAGTLGHSYNIEMIFDALNQLLDRVGQNVVFHIFGDGPYLKRFQGYAKKCKIPSVFHGRVAYPVMAAHLCKADIVVNPIVKGAAQSIINKHADYAAAGLPVVNTQECREYRSMLEFYGCGINCEVESVEQVAEALQELIENPEKRKRMGTNSRWMAEERFDRRNTYQQIVKVIEELVR
ncbi:MAG: glycosyltransferase family 4 protein, partial [Clostridia bacterium]|nr:glycosyltransferase family 4 protein [Clostridia bacterium]